MGRMGQPQELTGPLVLLCSRFAGGYVTGADLVVDGKFRVVRFMMGDLLTCAVGGQCAF